MKKKITEVSKRKYIYGTGLWARNVYQSCKDKGVNIDGFLVSNMKGNPSNLYDLPVLEYSHFRDRAAIIILGLNQHNAAEVQEVLKETEFPDNQIYEVQDIMNVEDRRVGYDEVPCIDVTTRVGCSVKCKYCPQDLFIKRYYESNKNRPTLLSAEVFSMCLDNLPKEANIQFGGFAEPFLNEDCIELIKIACDKGRTVNLYTTLIGLTKNKLKDLLKLPISYTTLHVADKYGYAKIPTTEAYYGMLEEVTNAKQFEGKPFVDMCNAQGEPDERVKEICDKNGYEVSYNLIDRAGNLSGNDLISKRIPKGRIYCGICGEKLNKNELLPDGTLLLCCMDYGMKHVLGNLKEELYENILKGTEIEMVRKGFDNNLINILCRKCSCAVLKK